MRLLAISLEGKGSFDNLLTISIIKENSFDNLLTSTLLHSDPLLAFLLFDYRKDSSYIKDQIFENWFYPMPFMMRKSFNGLFKSENSFLNINKSIFTICLSAINSKSDLDIIIDGNHEIENCFNTNQELFLADSLRLFQKYENLNWESIVKTIKLDNIPNYNNEILIHFELLDLFYKIKNEIGMDLYQAFYQSSIKYEEKFEMNRKSNENLSKPKYIQYMDYYEKVLRVLIDGPITIQVVRERKLEFYRYDFLKKIGNLIKIKLETTGNHFHFSHSFSHELLSLVFKWLIFSNPEFNGKTFIVEDENQIDNDHSYEKQISNDYDYLKKFFPVPFPSNSSLINISDDQDLSIEFLESWAPLIYLEAKEREREIINSLASIAEAFYGNDRETRGNYREIIDRYFGGNENNDIILIFLIIISRDKIFKNSDDLSSCFWEGDINQKFESPDPDFAIIGPIKLKNILRPKDHDYLRQRTFDIEAIN